MSTLPPGSQGGRDVQDAGILESAASTAVKALQPPNLAETVHNTRIYLDDIEAIVEMFLRHGLSVKVSSDKYEFDSVAEMRKELGNRPKQVHLSASVDQYGYEGVTTTFLPGRVAISTRGRFTELGLAAQKVLERTRPWYHPIVSYHVYGVVTAIVIAVTGVFGYIHHMAGKYFLEIVVAALILQSIGTWFGDTVGFLTLNRKSEGGWWRRNKRDVGLILGGAAAATLLQILAKAMGWL